MRDAPEDVLDPVHPALDTSGEEVDATFDLNASMKSDSEHITDTFCEEWVTHLKWDDRASLGLFLCFQLTALLGKGATEAAELAGMMIGKSDRTVREWRAKFFESGGEPPESKQGQYQRTGILWKNEDLNKKVA